MRDIKFDETPKDYSKAFLKQNPFPSTALPEENPRITADRKNEIEKFVHIINNVRHKGESTVAVFIGDYGSGKSHILRVFNTNVQEKLFISEKKVFPVLVKTPGRNLVDFLREVFTGVGRVRMTKIASQIIDEYIKKNHKKIKSLVNQNAIDDYEKEDFDLEFVLENIQINTLLKNIRKELPILIRDDDLFYTILFLAQESSRLRAWNWLTGSILTKEDRDHLMITESKIDARRAKTMLSDFVNIVFNSGSIALVFFIDEFENIGSVPSNQRKIFQDDVRDIVDEFTNKVVLLFAITPAVWKDFEKEPTALTRRLRSNMLYLQRFGEEEIKELIAAYLNSQRTEENLDLIKKKFDGCEPSFAPFTDEGIKQILSDSEGIVSDILEDCKHSLEHFIDSDVIEIDGNAVKKALKRSL